jgi:DNA-binding transcriptional LysR family regulator
MNAASEQPSGRELWSALEVRLLVAFVAVVDAGSFTAAARRLGYTQSGISQQIAALERIVGRPLLVRQAGGRRSIEPTPAGESLLVHSRIVLGQLDRAYAEVVAHEAEVAATVGVASFPSAAVHLVPAIEQALRAEPSLRLDLYETLGDDDSLAALETRRVELAFVSLPAPGPFAVEELGEDPYVAVVSAESPFAELRELGVEQLAGHSLLGLRHSAHEEVVEARLAAAGLDCRAFRRYDNNRLIQTLVRTGGDVAIVPSLTIMAGDEGIRVLDLRLDVPPRVIALAQLRDALLGPAARRFKQVAVPICRRILAGKQGRWERAAS